MFKRMVLACGISFLLGNLALAATNGDDVLGEWLTDGGQSKIEIFKKDGKYFGKISWLKEPNGPDGQPKVDNNNPDEARKKDPIVGLVLLKEFTFDGEGAWKNGEIYDPESGKTYKCTMKINEEGKLDVRGYIGVPAFGRSTVWSRPPKEESKPAVATETAAAPAPAATEAPKSRAEEKRE